MAAKKTSKKRVVKSTGPAASGAAYQFGFGSDDETQLAALVWKLGSAKARVIVDHVERIKSALSG
jgi:hypothetical protein